MLNLEKKLKMSLSNTKLKEAAFFTPNGANKDENYNVLENSISFKPKFSHEFSAFSIAIFAAKTDL